MKKNIIKPIITLVIIVAITLLWFSDNLPKQIAEIVASQYLVNTNSQHYRLTKSEYSSAHDTYLIYFADVDHPSSERIIGVNYRYLPFQVITDSNNPG